MALNIITFIILILMYFLIVVATIFKLIDISNNPQKYEERELVRRAYEKYGHKKRNYRGFFKTLSHKYSMVNLIFWVPLIFVGSVVIRNINKMFVGTNGYIFFGTQLIGTLCLLFLTIPIGMVMIPLLIKKPFFVVTSWDMFNTEDRPQIYLKSYLTFLIIFILTFPFIALSCNNYGYYDSKGLHVNQYFQIVENYTSYEEVDVVEIYVNHDNSGSISSLEYVVHLNNGDKVNINRSNMGEIVFAKCSIEIHQYLKNTNICNFIVTDLSDEDVQTYKKILSKEEFDILLEIFNVNKGVDSMK